MSLYLGTGYRCEASIACSFRVMPAGGEDDDLDEAVRARRAHEERCRYRGLDRPVESRAPRTIDERRDHLAVERVRLEDDTPEIPSLPPRAAVVASPPPVTTAAATARVFRCRCWVCGDMFDALGTRASYCSKPRCQEKRRSAA